MLPPKIPRVIAVENLGLRVFKSLLISDIGDWFV